MTSKLALLLLSLTLILSGCLGVLPGDEDDEDDEALDQTNASTPDNATNENASSHAAENTPPTASIQANETSGPAPLGVSFILDGFDEGGEELNWTFTVAEGETASNGTGLPTQVNHTYTEGGNHTATLTVDDGMATNQTSLTITVTGNGTGDQATDEPDDALPEPVVINGTALVGNPAHSLACLQQGIDGDLHEIAPAESGWSYALEPGDSFTVYWWADGEFVESGEDTGTVPSGATHAEVCMDVGSAMGSYTLSLWAPGHPDAPG